MRSVKIGSGFSWNARLFAQLVHIFLTKKIEHNFPFCADESAEPRPDMNIKVNYCLYSNQKVL